MSIHMPIVVLVLVFGAVLLGFLAYWHIISARLHRLVEPFQTGLQRAGIPIKSEALVFAMLGVAVIPWGAYMALTRPPIVQAAIMLAVTSCSSFFAVRWWIQRRIARRLTEFDNQLEVVLRLIAGALKVGLGLRQALVNVASDMPDPSRVEFARVLSQTQIGVSIHDALDALAERMPSREMVMMVSAIRLQSQTGGNLSRVLENLAATIKERRRLRHKVRALTAEARASKYIISALPLLVGIFIMSTQPQMRIGLMTTWVGRTCLMMTAGLIALGWFIFEKISVLDV